MCKYISSLITTREKTTVAFVTFKDLITGFSSNTTTLSSMPTEINHKLNSVNCEYLSTPDIIVAKKKFKVAFY